MNSIAKLFIRTGALAAALLASGCSMKPIDLTAQSNGSGLHPVAVKTSQFTIQTLQPKAVNVKVMRVYIEGDGRAWITSRTASDDPTPHKSMAPGFAIDDPSPSIYLARPCQYILSANCNTSLWTSKRFSQEVIQAESEVLDTLKSQFGVQGFELVGYSGGGAVALLLAAARDDVLQVQTIAGNIDPQAWTELKHITPLTGSLNPVDYAERLAKVPQRHLIGMNDTVVPPGVSKAYMLKVQPICGETVYIPADHYSGYEMSWKANRNKPVDCNH